MFIPNYRDLKFKETFQPKARMNLGKGWVFQTFSAKKNHIFSGKNFFYF